MHAVLQSVAASIAAVVAIVAAVSRIAGEPPARAQSAAVVPVTRTGPLASARPHPIAVEEPRPQSPPPVRRGTSLRQQVERLLLGTPRDRYQAFGVLANCAHALDFDRYLKSLPASAGMARLRERYGDGAVRIAAACGDLSARQLEQRVELAAAAADQGIPGAASAWIEEGPYGDATALTQRPDDPLVVQWAEQAIARVHAATRRSDTEAIGQFGLLCLNWEKDDVARVRLLVDAAQQNRREDRIKSMLN
ncbi:MAG TPA: hypothetical protein VLE94_17735 [Burkholderiaceae bacterium]|nr:hypothetical protein [Burkholderiaceae bacterium]